MDLSDLEWNGERPAAHPIHVTGTVRNMAGALLLEGEASTVLEVNCDRCLKPFTRRCRCPLETPVADELADEASEADIFLLEGDEIDVGEVARTAFILRWSLSTFAQKTVKAFAPNAARISNDGPLRLQEGVDPRLGQAGPASGSA